MLVLMLVLVLVSCWYDVLLYLVVMMMMIMILIITLFLSVLLPSSPSPLQDAMEELYRARAMMKMYADDTPNGKGPQKGEGMLSVHRIKILLL